MGFLLTQNHITIRKSLVLLVGRPGLDPGTSGLKEGYGWSDSSGGVGSVRNCKESRPAVSDSPGGVGMVRGKSCGILEQPKSLIVPVQVGPSMRTITYGMIRLVTASQGLPSE